MDPVAFAVGGFPNEFVEMGVVHEPAEPFTTCLIVGKMKVGCTSGLVVTVLDSTNGCIEFGATVAGTDYYWDSKVLS